MTFLLNNGQSLPALTSWFSLIYTLESALKLVDLLQELIVPPVTVLNHHALLCQFGLKLFDPLMGVVVSKAWKTSSLE